MPLLKSTAIFLVILICHGADAQQQSQDSDAEGSNISPESTKATATVMVIASFAPFAIVLGLFFATRFCRTNERDENEVSNLRAMAITNWLSQMRGDYTLRRIVLEKFFADDTKRVKAKDVVAQYSIIDGKGFNLSPLHLQDTCAKIDDSLETVDGETINEVKSMKLEHLVIKVNHCNKPDISDSDNSSVMETALIQDHAKCSVDRQDASIEISSEIQECNIIDENDDKISVIHVPEGLECGEPPLETEGIICPICLEYFNEDEFIITSKRCLHLFHKSCILAWLEKSDACPCCRETMITDEEMVAIASSVEECMIRCVML